MGFEGKVSSIKWDGVSKNATETGVLYDKVNRQTDKAAADLAGRFYFGASDITKFCSAPAEYPLYRYDKGTTTILIRELKTLTAICIDVKRYWLFFADLCHYEIIGCYLDPKTGDICECFVFKTF